MIATYKSENGDYQTPFSGSLGELLYLLGNQPNLEFQLSVEIEEIPKTLSGIRRAKGRKQSEVGNNMSAKYDQRVIANIESGDRKLGLTTLQDIAQSLGMKVQITFIGKCDFIKELPIVKDEYDEVELTEFV
jgi:hypothetical protein